MHLAITIVNILACFVIDNVKAATCKANEHKACFGKFDANTLMRLDPEVIDIPSICRVLTCINDLDCSLPPDLAGIDRLNDKLAPACPPTDSVTAPTADIDNECSIFTFRKCVDSDKVISSGTECPMQKCLSDLLPTCKNDIKPTVETMLYYLNKVCLKSCEVDIFHECYVDIMPLFGKKANELNGKSCKVLREAGNCAEKQLPDCDTGNIHGAIRNMTNFALCCDAVSVINECIPNRPMSWFQNKDDPFEMDSCADAEKTYSCLMAASTKCDEGEYKKVLNFGRHHGRLTLQLCEEHGYNLTISLETGKQLGSLGTAVQPLWTTIKFAVMLIIIASLSE